MQQTNMAPVVNNAAKKKSSLLLGVAIFLCVVGSIMIVFSILMLIIVVNGTLLFTTDIETGNKSKTKGIEYLIPNILNEWPAILIFVFGIIFLCVSFHLFKKA